MSAGASDAVVKTRVMAAIYRRTAARALTWIKPLARSAALRQVLDEPMARLDMERLSLLEGRQDLPR